MDHKILSMLSKFPLLESLFLYNCCFESRHSILTIFNYCATTLKEFHMTHDDPRMDINLVIPQQLEILELTSKSEILLSLKRSVKLRSLSAKCEYLTILVKDQLAYLQKVNLACSLNLVIQGNLENFITNVKELSIDLYGCHNVFGTLTNHTTIPGSNEVPRVTFGTYKLNFFMFFNMEKLRIVAYCDRNRIFLALPEGNRILVEHTCVKNGKHMEFIHNPSREPSVVKLVW